MTKAKKQIKAMPKKRYVLQKPTSTHIALARPSNPTFGAVTRINTAPVAIGNSFNGMKTQTIQTKDGMRVIGRDYAFTVASTGSVTNWALAGGLPTNPLCFASSVLSNCARMYSRYKVKRLVVHYITSSSTSQTGDIMFYMRKAEFQMLPNNTASTFLNFVLSDSNTIIGPQWTNHSAQFDTTNSSWLSTDSGANSETQTTNQYDIFLYSKTASSNSPGYVLIDYEYEFKEISLLPRAGNLALTAGAKGMWQPRAISFTNASTIGVTNLYGVSSTSGIGSTTIAAVPSDSGDIWEFVIDVTNSSFTTPNTSTLFMMNPLAAGASYANGPTDEAVTIADGMVIYVADGGTYYMCYLTKDAAYACSQPLVAGQTSTFSVILRGYSRCIGSNRASDLAYSQ